MISLQLVSFPEDQKLVADIPMNKVSFLMDHHTFFTEEFIGTVLDEVCEK
jgi:hypothetical protein